MIKFRCPGCQQKIAADDQQTNKQVRCPKCRAKVLVPMSFSAAVRTLSMSTGNRKLWAPCPSCAVMVQTTAASCKYCGEVLHSGSRQPNNTPFQNKDDSLPFEFGAIEPVELQPQTLSKPNSWVTVVVPKSVGMLAIVVLGLLAYHKLPMFQSKSTAQPQVIAESKATESQPAVVPVEVVFEPVAIPDPEVARSDLQPSAEQQAEFAAAVEVKRQKILRAINELYANQIDLLDESIRPLAEKLVAAEKQLHNTTAQIEAMKTAPASYRATRLPDLQRAQRQIQQRVAEYTQSIEMSQVTRIDLEQNHNRYLQMIIGMPDEQLYTFDDNVFLADLTQNHAGASDANAAGQPPQSSQTLAHTAKNAADQWIASNLANSPQIRSIKFKRYVEFGTGITISSPVVEQAGKVLVEYNAETTTSRNYTVSVEVVRDTNRGWIQSHTYIDGMLLTRSP